MSKSIAARRVTTTEQAIDGFLLSCKVEGKSYGTIECYTDKLKGFRWYAANHGWPRDIKAITTDHLREFLAYLRDTPHRFNSTCPRAMKPINSTTVQKYYRAISALLNWSINEGILEINPLLRIKVPRAEKKVVKSPWLKNGGDSLMLQRLLGHTTLMMTKRYCQAVGCYDAIESHKRYSPVDNLDSFSRRKGHCLDGFQEPKAVSACSIAS
jgi:site-specific recombinase XerD